ncbi:ribonuclease H-like domain-containing protein [Tanacetum coccineum]
MARSGTDVKMSKLFFVKDFLTRHILLRCDSSGDLYPVTQPSPIPQAFLSISPTTWHQRLGQPGEDVLHPLISRQFISCNKEKSSHICHACHLGKHVRLPFSSSNSIVTHCFEIIHSDIWTSPIDAMHDEYNALIKNNTWVFVLKPTNANVVRSMWLFRHKYHVDGSLSSWPIHDVKNVFLNGDLSETVYMYQPPGFVDSRFQNHVCRLQRSLYGLKQAPRAWFQQFVGYALKVGFSASRCDSSLFIYRHDTDIAYLLIYVDDIILTASSTDLLHRIISSLHKEFEMTDFGALNYFLGISVTRDSTGMFLSQRKYAMELLERAHMANCNSTRTPVDAESKLGSDGDLVSDPLYIVVLQGTLDFGLQLYSSPSSSLVAYTDADWAGCPTTRRSTSGYCVFLGDNLLSWSAKRQHTLSRSSAEAEYRGVANVVAETAWIRNLLRELHSPLHSATIVYCDNVSAVYLTTNPVQHLRTKHIEIDIHFVRDMVARGQVRVLHVPSRYQHADIFTKGLPTALFEEFRTS